MIISISIGSTSATARIINNNDAANYEDNNYSAMTAATRQRRVNFDGFQHRVEHQLGSAVFPASFAGLNSSLYHTATNYNNSSNNSSSHHQLLFSKRAQFFHPRQVLALRQYEGLLDASAAAAAAAVAGRQSDDTRDEIKDGGSVFWPSVFCSCVWETQ